MENKERRSLKERQGEREIGYSESCAFGNGGRRRCVERDLSGAQRLWCQYRETCCGASSVSFVLKLVNVKVDSSTEARKQRRTRSPSGNRENR